MNKEFTNQELKKLIYDLYIKKNKEITDDLKYKLNKSSKTRYEVLFNLYEDIKNYLENNNIIKIEIETQTDNIITLNNDEIITELKTENFKLKQKFSDYKYKILSYKKEIKNLNNKKINYISSTNYTSSDEEKEKWGLKPSQETLNWFTPENLKSLYPNLSDEEIKRRGCKTRKARF